MSNVNNSHVEQKIGCVCCIYLITGREQAENYNFLKDIVLFLCVWCTSRYTRRCVFAENKLFKLKY